MSDLPPAQILPGRRPLTSLLGDGGPRLAMLQALALVAPPGDVVEVGVYKGGSARVLEWAVAQRKGSKLWLYDTFGPGIPHADPAMGDSHRVGDFAGGLSFAEAKDEFPDAVVIAGVFPDQWMPLPVAVAFAHLDGDQYQTTRDSLATLFPRMVPGGLIVLDDYGLAGCARACHEARDRGHNLGFLPDGRACFRT